MHIASDRTYRFGVERDVVWSAIANVDGFRSMWPWLRRFDATELAPGASWRCTVQPPLPYSLSFTLDIDHVVEQQCVRAAVGGDITGEAEIMLTDRAEGCEVRLVSHLAPRSRFLQGIALVARPVAKLGHDWVLDTGARQFRQQLTSR
jgi:hypothetical protein